MQQHLTPTFYKLFGVLIAVIVIMVMALNMRVNSIGEKVATVSAQFSDNKVSSNKKIGTADELSQIIKQAKLDSTSLAPDSVQAQFAKKIQEVSKKARSQKSKTTR